MGNDAKIHEDTLQHIGRVREFIFRCTDALIIRAADHDKSKTEPPEAEVFDDYCKKLKGLVYGSDEYKAVLKEMKPCVDHHYSLNRHHPEHFPNGIQGMSLIDILEMLCDWRAACERHATGDIRKSVEINQKRFGYSDELKQVLLNTLEVLEK